MKFKFNTFFILFSSLTFFSFAQAQTFRGQKALQSQPVISATSALLLKNLQLNKFACRSDSTPDASGFHCRGVLPVYPLPLHFFLPSNLQNTSEIQLAVHFHGHNYAAEQDPFNLKSGNGDYGKFVVNSGANLVLVIPESAGRCDTYDQYFVGARMTELFFSQIKQFLSQNLKDLVPANKINYAYLSAHSGADLVTGLIGEWLWSQNLPSLMSLHGAALFDSLYNEEALLGWKKLARFVTMKRGTLLVAYDNRPCSQSLDCRPDRNAEVLAAAMPNARIFKIPTDIEHMSYMRAYMSLFYKKTEGSI